MLAPVEVLEPWADISKRGTDSGEVRALEGAGRGGTACVEVAASSCARYARRALLRTVEEVGGSIDWPVAASVLRRIDLRVEAPPPLRPSEPFSGRDIVSNYDPLQRKREGVKVVKV